MCQHCDQTNVLRMEPHHPRCPVDQGEDCCCNEIAEAISDLIADLLADLKIHTALKEN